MLQRTNFLSDRLDKKWAAFALLVFVQTAGSLVYKVSQQASQYPYSTFSALAIAELVKLTISVALYITNTVRREPSVDLPKDDRAHAGSRLQKVQTHLRNDIKHARYVDAVEITSLAAVYCVGNQIAFHIMLHADLASIVMFKSLTSFVVGLLRYFWLGEPLSESQWRAIALQICGLIVTQYNVCNASTLLSSSAYSVLAASVLISAFTSVWNERQLKQTSIPLLLQNAVLYTAGVVFNMVGHFATASSEPTGMFHGYSVAVIGVIVTNACTGIAITAVYKYADAVVKSLANSMTTVIVTVLSWMMFNLALNPVNASGCIVVAISVYTFSVSSTKSNVVSKM